MRHQHVNSAIFPEFPPEFQTSPTHLPLCVHIDAVRPVPVRSAEAGKPDSLIYKYIAVNTGTAFRRLFGKGIIVIPADIKQRAVSKRNQKLQIGAVQIPAGYNQINPVQPSRLIVIVIISGFFIRYE